MRFIFPNYKKNIINISATLAEFLGVGTEYTKLDILKKELEKGYKNVFFIIFDGLGIHPMELHLTKKSFLFKNLRMKLTSVFPSTTTNATTTLMTAKTPSEHGWFAWSLYFKDINKIIDIYLDEEHYAREKIDSEFVVGKIPHGAYYNNSKTEYAVNTVFPPYIKRGVSDNNFYYNGLDEQFEVFNKIANKDGKQFIYSYSPLPDSLMHDEGVSSGKAKEIIKKINNYVEELSRQNDTLIIVTADHGQTDVSGYIKVWEDKELMNFFEVLPFGDARALFAKVKQGQDEEFLRYIKIKYKNDIKAFSSKKLMKDGVFGKCNNHKDLLGDYILVMKNDKHFVLCENDNLFKGHHTGLLKEMLVPLIMIGNKNL